MGVEGLKAQGEVPRLPPKPGPETAALQEREGCAAGTEGLPPHRWPRCCPPITRPASGASPPRPGPSVSCPDSRLRSLFSRSPASLVLVLVPPFQGNQSVRLVVFTQNQSQGRLTPGCGEGGSREARSGAVGSAAFRVGPGAKLRSQTPEPFPSPSPQSQVCWMPPQSASSIPLLLEAHLPQAPGSTPLLCAPLPHPGWRAAETRLVRLSPSPQDSS